MVKPASLIIPAIVKALTGFALGITITRSPLLINPVHVENRSFSSSGLRVVVTHKRSAISKGF